MDIEKNKLVLALLLINKGEPFNNSYRLVRIFEHKFRINPIYILKEIREKGYAGYELKDGVHYYKMTLEGRNLIEKEYRTAIETLLDDCPKESDFINALFNSFYNSQ